MTKSLLVELLTEELPPKSLKAMSEAFGTYMYDYLSDGQLLTTESEARKEKVFATPRRIAVLFHGVLEKQAGEDEEAKPGPYVKDALNADGTPNEKLVGFSRRWNVAVEKLDRTKDEKGRERFYAKIPVKRKNIEDALADIVTKAIQHLPIAKQMVWGDGVAKFVRPVHGLVMLHGTKIIPGTVLGLSSGNRTKGHRFMGKSDIVLANADEYEKKLLDDGRVIADFAVRREEIERQLAVNAKKHHSRFSSEPQWLSPQEEFNGVPTLNTLIDEVTALVEYPTVYVGEFDPAFLEVPQECLILTMRQNQKYFPLFDATGKLLPKFLIVSNMEIANPRNIIDGNQRVVRPRLEDARFFFNQDKKIPLEDRVQQLDKVVYHNKLGTQLQRVRRIEALASLIAGRCNLDSKTTSAVRSAAHLCKADLLTGMVMEFPELQGVMGRYYAVNATTEVADAIETHYYPRFSGDRIPVGPVATSVALADKLDTLAGIFSIGSTPTGEKDPFGLRRQALGILRILIETPITLDLGSDLLEPALTQFVLPMSGSVYESLVEFVRDRLRSYLRERGYLADEIEAAIGQTLVLGHVIPLLEAAKEFKKREEWRILAAAHKRARNILKTGGIIHQIEPSLEIMQLDEERELLRAMRKIPTGFRIDEATQTLNKLSTLGPLVDAFFAKVMVMDKDESQKSNRLALMRQLEQLMNQVVDISKLAA